MSLANLNSQSKHSFFPESEESLLREEDSAAFSRVTGILLFVVSVGLLLIMLTVALML